MSVFAGLETPCLILDKARLAGNLARMAAAADRLGVALRPHLKTVKSAKIGDMAVTARSWGITVSTLREAEYFADHGFRDITYAVGISPGKLDRAAALVDRGVDLKLLADTVDAATAVADHGTAFKLLIEVDCGDHRGGVSPDGEVLLAMAEALHGSDAAQLEGVLTHAGHSYGTNDIQGIEKIAEEERAAVTRAADRLRGAGHNIHTVSAGSTPTALFSRDATGLTEYRAGVYTVFDLDQQSRGVCSRDELAMSVLSTVIGHNREAGKILLDAGGLAMSKDTGANAFRPEVGYGEVWTEAGAPIPDLYVTSVSQEHGHVVVSNDSLFDQLPVGSLVRVMPNHACMTAAAYDRYHVLEDGRLTEEWDRCNGW